MNTTREPVAEPVATPRHALIRRPLGHCPECSSIDLDPVVALEAEQVHFLCRNCGRCWHVELGYVQRVRPTTCHACSHRDACLALYEADLASR